MAITQSEFELAIIGAGPAGSSAAITAARFGARVALLEASEFPRHKVCGEFISAESLDILRNLLIDSPDAAQLLAVAPVVDQVRFLLDRASTAARISPPGLSLSRYDLDHLLWQAAKKAGVCARSSWDVRSITGDGPFVLENSAGRVKASAVIVAAGRWSRFRPKSPVPAGPKWVGLKAHFRESTSSHSTDLYFFDRGYCGVQPVSDYVVNACAMVRSDRATALQEVLRLAPALAERSRDWQPLMEPVTTAPLIYRMPEPVRENLIFVGDAAAFIDPFVGDGISIGLRTGQLAATEVLPVLKNSAMLPEAVANYRQKYEERFVPLITAASRIRQLLSWPKPAQFAVLEMLRLPGLMPYLIRSTRKAH